MQIESTDEQGFKSFIVESYSVILIQGNKLKDDCKRDSLYNF